MKVGFFANSDFYLYNFRLHLMKTLKDAGFEVFAVAPITNDFFVSEIEKNGIIFLPCDLKRGVYSFLSNLKYFWQIFKICRKNKFDICHNFTFKSNILATISQKLVGIPRVFCSVTGLGSVYVGQSLIFRILRTIADLAYRLTSVLAQKIFFQNQEDLNYFLSKKIVAEHKTVLIFGSGVDTQYFSPLNIENVKIESLKKEIGKKEGDLILTMISRLLWSKGAAEFVKAAEILKQKYKNLIFFLVGPLDLENPEGVPFSKIEEWQKNGLIKYLGERRDVREILFLSDVFVFPSYYREGVPRILLEAGSMEKPLVAADNIGSKEVVENNINGFLVKSKNSQKVAEAIEKLILDKDLREKFGRAAREKVIREFEEKGVIEKTMKVYQETITKKQ